MNIFPFVKKFWHDPVWSNVIAGTILTLFGVLFTYYWVVQPTPAVATGPEKVALSTPAIAQVQVWPPITLDVLNNLTYQIDGEYITLQNGKREFNPGSDRGIHDKAIFVHFVDHAFGDIDGDGSSDAIAVLQVSDGGSGIYYYLSTVYNDHGSPKVIGPAFVLGDRLEFRSVSIRDGKVAAQLMMHKPEDTLCCPSLFRTLEFVIKDKALLCRTEPCSEL